MTGKNWVLIGVGMMAGIILLGWWRDQNAVAEPEREAEEQKSELEQINWQLQDYAGETEYQTVIIGTTITAEFADGTLTGNAGCNSYFADSTMEKDQLLIGTAGTTMIACDPPVMDQEQAYLALLPQVQAYKITSGQLTLLNDKGQGILIYNRMAGASLEETPWQATGVNNGKGGVESTATTELITAQFVGGTVSGYSGCNNYSGEYAVEGETITIGPVAGTLRACADEAVSQQESEYLKALEQATVYQIKQEILELRDETGALQVSYQVGQE